MTYQERRQQAAARLAAQAAGRNVYFAEEKFDEAQAAREARGQRIADKGFTWVG